MRGPSPGSLQGPSSSLLAWPRVPRVGRTASCSKSLGKPPWLAVLTLQRRPPALGSAARPLSPKAPSHPSLSCSHVPQACIQTPPAPRSRRWGLQSSGSTSGTFCLPRRRLKILFVFIKFSRHRAHAPASTLPLTALAVWAKLGVPGCKARGWRNEESRGAMVGLPCGPGRFC